MKHKKITALILSCAFALSGCGGAGQQGKEQMSPGIQKHGKKQKRVHMQHILNW